MDDSCKSKHGRLLAYLVLPDGRDFGLTRIIAEGYGFEFTYRLPHRYEDAFKAAQRKARA